MQVKEPKQNPIEETEEYKAWKALPRSKREKLTKK